MISMSYETLDWEGGLPGQLIQLQVCFGPRVLDPTPGVRWGGGTK